MTSPDGGSTRPSVEPSPTRTLDRDEVPRTTPSAGSPGGREPAARGGFRPDVEGLRSVAILPVVAYHAALFAGLAAGVPVLSWVVSAMGRVTGGFLGVDVFFVISGFLITGLLVRETDSGNRIRFGRFYARRARRILPAASLTLVVTVAAAYLILPAARAASTAVDAVWAALFNADIHFAVTGVDYLGVATDPSPVLHFWSLNDEEKFYALWPAVMAAAALLSVRLRRAASRPTMFAALLALGLASLWWSQRLVRAGDPSAYFSAPSRAFELAAGGLLAIAWPAVERLPRTVRNFGAFAGIAVVLTSMMTYTTLTPFPGVWALPVVIGTVLALAGHPSGGVARALSIRPARWVGRVSYSLYLWHWPVLVLAAAAAGGHLAPAPLLAWVAVAFLLAWASWRFVEQPPQRAAVLRSTRAALTFGLALIIGTVGASVWVGRHAQANVAAFDSRAAQGITPVAKTDRGLLWIGDSVTARGMGPLEAALAAAGWQYHVDALGGRPIVSGKRATWTPLCLLAPMCGADLVLRSVTVPGTVVVDLGLNSEQALQYRIAPPSPTDSGLRDRVDSAGHLVFTGQDSPAQIAAEVRQIMMLVPSTTTVYWVSVWLNDRIWANVTWRQTDAAIKATAATFPNARFLDWAGYVQTAHVPYMPDGSHPTPDGLVERARWLVARIH